MLEITSYDDEWEADTSESPSEEDLEIAASRNEDPSETEKDETPAKEEGEMSNHFETPPPTPPGAEEVAIFVAEANNNEADPEPLADFDAELAYNYESLQLT